MTPPPPIVAADMSSTPALPPLPGSKPPRPALARPLHLTAYTKPHLFKDYIQNVLTPATASVARSSLTTIVDTATLANLRNVNGEEFREIVAHEIKYRLKDASSAWIREELFRQEAFPEGFKRKFQAATSLWKHNTETWVKMPQQLTEPGMVGWLNWIASEFGQLFEHLDTNGHAKKTVCYRTWDKRTANTPPMGGTMDRKPDLVLLSHEVLPAGEKVSWPIVQAFAEITQQQGTYEKVTANMVEKAYLMFESQPFRRYVIALGFFGQIDEPKWALVFVDRAGVISSSQFSFEGTGGITLARVLYALNFASPRHIGIDETMTIDPTTGVVTHITVTGEAPQCRGSSITRRFEIVRLVHATAQISGRATRVWLVREQGCYFILKDSWPLETQPFCEIRHLLTINRKIMSDTENRKALKHTYPILIVGQEFDDSTFDRREELLNKPPSRAHRRIVTKPIGNPLTSFRSKLELCNVLCDVVTYLKYTSETCLVCHGDISLNNILINRVWDDDDDDDDDVNDNSNDNNDIINESGASNNTADPGQIYTTCDSSNSELSSLADSSVNSATELSSNVATITNLPSTSNPVPPKIKGYGLTIDNDNSFSLEDNTEYGYRINSGTLPFMAIDALYWKKPSDFTHKPKHDLESLFYVLLTLCTYTTGPGCLRSHIPEAEDPSICLNDWWATCNRHSLARSKAGQIQFFVDCILDRLPSYWADFHPVLLGLREALWAKERSILTESNIATHDAFLKVLKEAQEKYREEEDVQPFAPMNKPNREKPNRRGRKKTGTESVSHKRKGNGEGINEGTDRGKKAARTDSKHSAPLVTPSPQP